MIEKNKLDDYALLLFEEIVQRHPDWSKFAENGNPDFDNGFTISIDSPVEDNPPLEIMCGSDPEALVIGYGCNYLDNYDFPRFKNPAMFYPNIDEVADTIDELVKIIMDEQLISAEWKTDKRKLFSNKTKWERGLINRETFEKIKARYEIIRSVSWKGSFNFNYNGHWETMSN